MLKKTDTPGIFKNTKTGALVNKNTDKLSAYKAQKNLLREARETAERNKSLEQKVNVQEAAIAQLQQDIKSLKSAVNALKKKAE